MTIPFPGNLGMTMEAETVIQKKSRSPRSFLLLVSVTSLMLQLLQPFGGKMTRLLILIKVSFMV